jgi:hypothetical protein
MPTFECKQHPGFSSSHVVFSNGRARVTTQAQLDSLKPFMGMITKISDEPELESEPAQIPEPEKAVHTGKGWWRWKGRGYRRSNLPEEALP